MPEAARCEVTELLVDQCAHCRHAAGRPPRRNRWRNPAVPARFPGRCAAVPDHPIEPGDLVANVPGVGWCCEDCADVS